MAKKETNDKTAKNIKCDVDSCMYNDHSNENCTLDEIKVSCECNNEVTNKKETICNSFECNDNCE